MRQHSATACIVTVAALLSWGCTTNTLVFTTYTNFGLDISAANGTPTKAVFGYKRFEGAVVPVDPSKRTATDGDAMSLLAAMDLENGWLNGLTVVEVFATGPAAVNAASNPEAFAEMLQKFGPTRVKPHATPSPAAGTP